MTRLATIVGLLIVGFLSPLSAFAFWLPNDGQCLEFSPAAETVASVIDEVVAASGCGSVLDPTDPSYNACFELAEHPISTLPELIAQTQAERLVAAIRANGVAVTVAHQRVPVVIDTSIDDPAPPEPQIVHVPSRPRRANSCSVYPDDCERAPAIPNLNLDGSVPQADASSVRFEVPPPITPQQRRGPPSPGVGPSTGIVARLDRPPQVG